MGADLAVFVFSWKFREMFILVNIFSTVGPDAGTLRCVILGLFTEIFAWTFWTDSKYDARVEGSRVAMETWMFEDESGAVDGDVQGIKDDGKINQWKLYVVLFKAKTITAECDFFIEGFSFFTLFNEECLSFSLWSCQVLILQ